MRAREWLYEVRDPKVAAMQRAMRNAGALNVEGPNLGKPLTVDGKEGPNTRYNMDRPEFSGIVRRYKNPSAPYARNVADADSLAPGEELAPPSAADRAAISHVQTGIDSTQPTNPLKGVTGTAASPLPSLNPAPVMVGPEDDYIAPHTAPNTSAAIGAAADARPAMPHTPTPTSVDPIVRQRQGLPPATTAEIDAYEKAHPAVVGNVVDGSGKPIISGGQKDVIDAARKAAPKELDGHQQAQNMLQPGYNTKTGPNANISQDTRDSAKSVANAETGGNFDITFGDHLDSKTKTIVNGKYKTVAQWSKETLGTPLQLTQLTLDQVKAFQAYKDSVKADSGAVGAYQFMPNTLFGRMAVDRKGKSYFAPGVVQELKIPMTAKFDQQLQDKLYDKFSASNDSVLKNHGIPITSANRYMAHYIGATGATEVYDALATNPSMTIAQVLVSNKHKDPTGNNPELAILTVGQFPDIMAKRMAGDIGYGRPSQQQFAALADKRRTQLAAANNPKPPVA